MQAVVHVCDPGQPGKTQDFTCNIITLMQGMRYFHDVLQKATQNRISPVEISVHCDVAVFEWLLGYCCGKTTRDHITIDQALPLLIASNFLQMDSLVTNCLGYMAAHLLQVAQHQHELGGPGGDLAALPLDLLSRLAKLVPDRSLEQLVAVRNAEGRKSHMPFVNRLYKYKLEGCLRDLRTTLTRCSVCQCLFSLADRAKLECQGPPPPHSHHQSGTGGMARSKAADGVAGRASGAQAHAQRRSGGSSPSVHIPDAAWRLQDHLAALRAQNIPWRGIYWHVWGLVHVVYCHSCMQYLPAAALHRCTYHPQAPVFAAAPLTAPGAPTSGVGVPSGGPAMSASGGPRPAAMGFYPCCGAAACRGVDPRVAAATGCCTRNHRLMPAGQPPGAALPSELTPALLDTLGTCAELFTNPGALLVREEDSGAAAAAAGAGIGVGIGASATDGGGSTVMRRKSGSSVGLGSPPRIRNLASYSSHDRRSTAIEGSGVRFIPPALQALLSSTAAAATVACNDGGGAVALGGGRGGGLVSKSSSSSSGPAALGLLVATGGPLGPAAAAAAAALGYRLNSFSSVEQPGTSGPGPPQVLPTASQVSSMLLSQATLPASAQLSQPAPSWQQPIRSVSSSQPQHASGTSSTCSLQPALSLTSNPLLLDARSLAAEVVRRLSQSGSVGGASLSASVGGFESAAAAAAPDTHGVQQQLQQPAGPGAAAVQASSGPMPPQCSVNTTTETAARSSDHNIDHGQQQQLQQGRQQQGQKQQQQHQQPQQQQRHQARRSFTSIAALQQEAFDQALLAEAEEMAVRGGGEGPGEGAPGAGWNGGQRSGAGSPLSLYSGGGGSGTPVVLSPRINTTQQAGTTRPHPNPHPHPSSLPQPPPGPHSPHARLLSAQSSPHSPYQQQPTRPHSPLRPVAATVRGALTNRGVRAAPSGGPPAAAAAPPPSQSPSAPDYALQSTGAVGPAASFSQILASTGSGEGGGESAVGSSTAGGRQWGSGADHSQLGMSALSAELLLATGRMSRPTESQLRASLPLELGASSASASGRRAEQQIGYQHNDTLPYEQQQLHPMSQPSPVPQSPVAKALPGNTGARPSSNTSSPYQNHHQQHPHHHHHNSIRHTHHQHHHNQQHRQHFHSHHHQPQTGAAEQLMMSEHALRSSHQRSGKHHGSGPSGSAARREFALPPRPAHRIGGSSISSNTKLRRRPSEAGGSGGGHGPRSGGGGVDATMLYDSSDTDLNWLVESSAEGGLGRASGGRGGGGGGVYESSRVRRGARDISPQAGMAAAAGAALSGRGGGGGVRWSQLSMVSASSDGDGSGGGGGGGGVAGNPLQRSVQAALMQQRQRRQEPPQGSATHLQQQQHLQDASRSPPPQRQQQRPRQRSAGRARGPPTQAAAADVRRSAGSIGSEAADHVDPARQALIEQYKTQRVLSPRPSNVQMIAISELPAGSAPGTSSGGGFRPADGMALGGGRGEESASMMNMNAMPYRAGGAGQQSLPYKSSAGGSHSSSAATAQWLRHSHRGSDDSGVGLGTGGRRFMSSSTAPGGFSSEGDIGLFATGLYEADDGCGGGGFGAANSTAGGLAASPAHRGRKLRMELLYEDDNYRMDLLVQHLLACRPSTRGSLGTKEREPRPPRGRPSHARPIAPSRGGAGTDKPGSRPTSAAASIPSSRQQRPRSQSVSNMQRLISVYGAPPNSVHARAGGDASVHAARTHSATMQGDMAYNSGWQDGGSFGRSGDGERGCSWVRVGSGLVDSHAGGGGRQQELRPLSAPRMRRYA